MTAIDQAASARRGMDPAVERVTVSAYTIPTDQPEADGTFDWDHTTLVVVEVDGGGARGLGYTYGDAAAATLVRGSLAGVVHGKSTMDVQGAWIAMVHAVRNSGRPGIASHAIAAVDVALWDLKAHLLDLPLATLLGAARPAIEVYGSGGFTSYSVAALQKQLAGWTAAGISRVKMKIGRNAEADIGRIAAAREAIGDAAELFVDANGAYSRKQALDVAERIEPSRVCWFEEPVSSDDLEGLRLLRDRAPAPIEIAAGEYGYDAAYFRRMLEAGAVDVLQADATRCGGITGFLQAAALADAFGIPLSAHTAPSLHLAPCCAINRVRHIEYFHDHVRIEQMLLDGAARPRADGCLYPDRSRPGLGLELKRSGASRFEVR
jgi:L-alanine-DL-glutamate epimerase-like enolase superfamily enzyme